MKPTQRTIIQCLLPVMQSTSKGLGSLIKDSLKENILKKIWPSERWIHINKMKMMSIRRSRMMRNMNRKNSSSRIRSRGIRGSQQLVGALWIGWLALGKGRDSLRPLMWWHEGTWRLIRILLSMVKGKTRSKTLGSCQVPGLGRATTLQRTKAEPNRLQTSLTSTH